MKKITFILLVLISNHSFSQDDIPFTFGPMVSMTSTTLDAKEFRDQVSGSGYNIGAFGRLKILFLYGQLELAYSTKSSAVTFGEGGTNSNVTYELNGMDVTLIAGLKLFGLGELGNFRIFAGYNLNNYSDVSYKLDGNDISAENVNDNNSSIVGGIGIDVSRFTIDLKYLKGLSDLASAGDLDVNTKVVCVSLGFKILD